MLELPESRHMFVQTVMKSDWRIPSSSLPHDMKHHLETRGIRWFSIIIGSNSFWGLLAGQDCSILLIMIYQLINVGVSLAQNDHFSAKKTNTTKTISKDPVDGCEIHQLVALGLL